MSGRGSVGVLAGRVGLSIAAAVSGWAAWTTAANGHGGDAVLVGAPVAAPSNPHPTPTPRAPRTVGVTAAGDLGDRGDAAPARVSRDHLRAPLTRPGRRHTPL